MRKVLILVVMFAAHLSFGQTEEFNSVAKSYINGDFESAKTTLLAALNQYPEDVQLKALADKLGMNQKENVETGTAEPQPIQVKEDPKPVVKNDPKTEATKALLYQNANGRFDLDIENGEKLVCMFSLTCGHCQEAYKDLCAMSKQGNLPKMYLYCFGQEFEQNFFFKQAGDNCKDAYVRTENYADFTRLLEGESFPRILAFKNGKIVKSWNIKTYNENSVREFYNIPKPQEKKPQNDGINIEGGSSDSPWGGGDNYGGGNPWD